MLVKDKKLKLSHFQELFGLEIKNVKFPYGAIMAVPKEVILRRPLSFYLRLLSLTASDIDCAMAMEPLWVQVFYDEENDSRC